MTWSDAGAGRLVDPTFADASYAWAHPEGSAGATLSETSDGGSTWRDYLAPCPSDTPVIDAAVATASRAGYVICLAVPGTGDQPWRLVQVTPDGKVATRYQGTASTGAALHGLLDDYVQGFTMQAGGRGLIWGARASTRPPMAERPGTPYRPTAWIAAPSAAGERSHPMATRT